MDLYNGIIAFLITFYIDLTRGSSYVGYSAPFHVQEELFPSEKVNQLPQLYCNDDNNALFGETTDENHVQYYGINITTKLKQYNSLMVSTCCNYPESYCGAESSLDTYLYLFSTKRDKLLLREIADDTDLERTYLTCNNTQKSILDITQYSTGVYVIAVGGFDGDIGSYRIQLNCISSIASSHYIGYLYFSIFGVFLLGFGAFYLHEYRRYHHNNPAAQNVASTTKASEDAYIVNVMALDDDEMSITKRKDNIHASDDEYNCLSSLSSMKTERRVLNGNETREMLMANKEDVILALLGHVEASCNDEHGLDIYQVLAIRAMHPASNQPKLVQPFKALGCNIELIKISQYHTALFIAIVTSLLQSMGITVVVYKLMISYFYDDNVKCALDTNRWNEVYSLKMLSFLWSLVITFSIGAQLGALRRNGLYRMVAELNHREICSIEYINFWWIRAGQILNYYACLLSVIGSFFIIFETNSGEMENGERDYAHSGLDMVLNAVALFFMLELDDCLVSYQDFRDIECIVHEHFQSREEYVLLRKNGNHLETKSSIDDKIKYCGSLTELIAFFVKFWLYVFGIFAPFAVFLCY